MLTILAVIAAAIWIVGIFVILWATTIMPDTRTDAGGNFPLALTMAVLWPIWLVIGALSGLIAQHRINKFQIKNKHGDDGR
jgi:uncharacterized membrane protein YphA (DoxX/SURF4 family)